MNIEVGDKVKVKWGFRNIKGRHIGVGSIPDYLAGKIGTVIAKSTKALDITFDEYDEHHQNNGWTWDYNWIEKELTEEDEFRKLLIES